MTVMEFVLHSGTPIVCVHLFSHVKRNRTPAAYIESLVEALVFRAKSLSQSIDQAPLLVINSLVCTEPFDEVFLLSRAGSNNVAAEGLGDLYCPDANAAGTSVDENAVSGLGFAERLQILPGGQTSQAYSSNLGKGQILGLSDLMNVCLGHLQAADSR